jgi:hypothetical protein
MVGTKMEETLGVQTRQEDLQEVQQLRTLMGFKVLPHLSPSASKELHRIKELHRL